MENTSLRVRIPSYNRKKSTYPFGSLHTQTPGAGKRRAQLRVTSIVAITPICGCAQE
jgi:hypothetical protein